MNGRISSECVECGCQIFYEDTVWVDNSGGDACGDKNSHTPFLDENMEFLDENDKIMYNPPNVGEQYYFSVIEPDEEQQRVTVQKHENGFTSILFPCPMVEFDSQQLYEFAKLLEHFTLSERGPVDEDSVDELLDGYFGEVNDRPTT